MMMQQSQPDVASVASVASIASTTSVRSALSSAPDVGKIVPLHDALYVTPSLVPTHVQRAINDCRLLSLAFRDDPDFVPAGAGTWCVVPRGDVPRGFATLMCVRVASPDGGVVSLDATCGEDGTWFVPGAQLRLLDKALAASASADAKFTSLAALVSRAVKGAAGAAALHGVVHWVPPRMRASDVADANKALVAELDAFAEATPTAFQLHHIALRQLNATCVLGYHLATRLAFCINAACTHVHVSPDMRAAIDASRAFDLA